MTGYERRTADALVGRKIGAVELSGYHVRLTCGDGTVLEYEATDGGCSCWSVTLPDGSTVS